MTNPKQSEANSQQQGRLVGRHAELSRILAALEVALTQSGRFVLMSGEAGVGKTRLAQEVLKLSRARGLRVMVGRCFEQYASVPFFPFTEAFTGAFAAQPDEAVQRWPELSHILPDVSAATPKPAQETQLQLFQTVTAFLQHLAQPEFLVLLLEDLHWADVTSLGLLLYLGRHLQSLRILVIGTYRDVEVGCQHPLEDTLRELIRERLVDEVHLRRLDRQGTAALIGNQLSAEKVPDELVNLVYEHAEGNPFLTEELVKALAEQGAIYEAGGRWAHKHLSEIEVPHSVRSIVGQRVSRLPSSTQELLRIASVLGPEFELPILRVTSGLDESQLLDHLDAALGARLLEERRSAGAEHYAFAHVLIQQTLYQELPGHRRRRLHLRVGQAIESLNGGEPSVIVDLARHFDLAGDRERATKYAIQAGDQASARFADAEAVHQYELALDFLGDGGDKARIAYVQYRLAGELYDMNRIADAVAAYESALAGYELLEDQLGQALVHGGLGRLHNGVHDFMRALPHFNAALGLWPAAREEAKFAALLLEFSTATYESGDSAMENILTERALALAERLGDPMLLAHALWRSAVQRFRHDPRPRIRIEREIHAIGLAQRARDWRTLSRLYRWRSATSSPSTIALGWD